MTYVHTDATTVTQMNEELQKIELALEEKVSRLPEGERVMEADLDMNANRILNLRKPTTPNEPVRLIDLAGYDGGDIIIPPSGGNGITYVTEMPTSPSEGETLYQQNTYDLGFSVNDGDSTHILEFSLKGAAAYSAGGGTGGSSITLGNAGGTGTTLLKPISSDSYEVKRLKAGSNVTLSDDGNGVTINASGVGGGTTTLSNAGTTGLPLVSDIVGANYPIRRIQAGTNVTITDNGTYYTINSSGGGGGGSLNTIQNVNDAIGVGIYKETIGSTAYFRRVVSTDNSLGILSDADDVDFSVNSVGFSKVNTVPTGRLLGRSTAGTGATEAISIGANLTLSGGVLSATGGGVGVTDGDKGDIVVTGSGATWSFDSGVVSTFARTLLDDTSAAAMRTTLGLGTAATEASSSFQPADSTLTALSGVTTAANQLVYATGADTFATTAITALARSLLGGVAVNNMMTTLGIITITNANGTALRFPTAGATSGIQICFKTGLSTGAISVASGNIFTGASTEWAFPVAFSSPPAVVPFISDNTAAWVGGGQSAITTLATYFRGYSGVSGTTSTVCMIAIGTY